MTQRAKEVRLNETKVKEEDITGDRGQEVKRSSMLC